MCDIQILAKLSATLFRLSPGKTAQLPIVRPVENRLSSGEIATWIGTIWSENTRMNSTFLPLKLIQAKPYAARAAMTIGKTVAGITMTSEFRNDWPTLMPPSSKFSVLT